MGTTRTTPNNQLDAPFAAFVTGPRKKSVEPQPPELWCETCRKTVPVVRCLLCQDTEPDCEHRSCDSKAHHAEHRGEGIGFDPECSYCYFRQHLAQLRGKARAMREFQKAAVSLAE